jgi:hypothetical protein
LKNLDDFFGEDQGQNVDTLVAVTKKFFTFVSQLAEIVDELGKEYSELSNKVDQLLKNSGPISAPPRSPTPVASLPSSVAIGTPPQIPTAPSAPPTAPTAAPPGFPTPPSPTQATAPPPAPTSPLQAEISQAMQNRSSPPAAPSGLPPLPGAPAAAPPGFGQSQPPGPGGPGGAPAPNPRVSPMNLKAQMNMELKEAFARIKKGWSEEDQ